MMQWIGWRRQREAWRPPETAVLIGSATLVGLATGLGAVAFVWLMARVGELAAWLGGRLPGPIGLAAIMALAGAVVGLLVDRWASEAKGHGVPEVMEAVAIRGGRIRPRVAAVKVLASSITIGFGGSAGREGPIVQVGSALGSTLGQLLGFSNERVRTLVACGAAAGIAATFNAPIAGAIFALEVVLGSFTSRFFGAVVISSVAAAIVSRVFLAGQPAFAVPAYPLKHIGELPIYALLGVLAALVALLFIRLLYAAESRFDDWTVPLPVKAALGMGLTGLLASLAPERAVLGSGLHVIGEMIAGNVELGFGVLLSLLILKLLATTFTLGSGNSGGVFAPSLFMGATLGGLVGATAHQLWPALAVDPGAYAIVGMAAVFAGAARAPITAVLIIFEMSGDYQLILPLMLATVLSTLIAEALYEDSIYTLKLKRKGISLSGGRDVDVLAGITVGEVMVQEPETVSGQASLTVLADAFRSSHRQGLLVLDAQGRLDGIVTVSDLDRAAEAALPAETPVRSIATPARRLVLAHPDETMGDALSRMGVYGFGRLPVVGRDDAQRLLGVIRRGDIIRAYRIGLARRTAEQHRTQWASQPTGDDTTFVEIGLVSGDRAVGRKVADLGPELPRDCILVSVQRAGRTLIPDGGTLLEPGDLLTVFVRSRDRAGLLGCLRSDAAARLAHAEDAEG
ncbi:MAG: chloride channel protein [Chloroflexi bacterium]|nr:chloride channel protein [Chloroflexota bacterium]